MSTSNEKPQIRPVYSNMQELIEKFKKALSEIDLRNEYGVKNAYKEHFGYINDATPPSMEKADQRIYDAIKDLEERIVRQGGEKRLKVLQNNEFLDTSNMDWVWFDKKWQLGDATGNKINNPIFAKDRIKINDRGVRLDYLKALIKLKEEMTYEKQLATLQITAAGLEKDEEEVELETVIDLYAKSYKYFENSALGEHMDYQYNFFRDGYDITVIHFNGDEGAKIEAVVIRSKDKTVIIEAFDVYTPTIMTVDNKDIGDPKDLYGNGRVNYYRDEFSKIEDNSQKIAYLKKATEFLNQEAQEKGMVEDDEEFSPDTFNQLRENIYFDGYIYEFTLADSHVIVDGIRKEIIFESKEFEGEFTFNYSSESGNFSLNNKLPDGSRYQIRSNNLKNKIFRSLLTILKKQADINKESFADIKNKKESLNKEYEKLRNLIGIIIMIPNGEERDCYYNAGEYSIETVWMDHHSLVYKTASEGKGGEFVSSSTLVGFEFALNNRFNDLESIPIYLERVKQMNKALSAELMLTLKNGFEKRAEEQGYKNISVVPGFQGKSLNIIYLYAENTLSLPAVTGNETKKIPVKLDIRAVRYDSIEKSWDYEIWYELGEGDKKSWRSKSMVNINNSKDLPNLEEVRVAINNYIKDGHEEG